MKKFKQFLDEGIGSWLRKHNPKRLAKDADKATKIALARKSPTSVRRALNLKAAREAERVGDRYDRQERIRKAVNPKARVLGAGGWSSGGMSKYSSIADAIKESKWDKYLYHATYNNFDPKDIRPGSHFGTLPAAMARAKQELNDSRKWFPKKAKDLKVHVYKYIKKRGAKRLTNQPDPTTKHWKWKDVPKNASVSYENDFEDPGSTSHVIYDTKNLKPVHTFQSPKFVKRKYANNLLGTGDEQDNAYRAKKGRKLLKPSKIRR